MKLTRKDYETLAEMVRHLPANVTREQVAVVLSETLKGSNLQYDASRFFAAATKPLDGTVLTEGNYYPDRKVHDPYNSLPEVRTAEELTKVVGLPKEDRQRYHG